MTRLNKAEVDLIAARFAAEGWCDRGFDDRFEQGPTGRVNVGAARAAKKLTATAKNRLGLRVRYKQFRFSGDNGGVVLAAAADRADQIFAEYGEGWNS